jgi:SAM-dependent methyltransferase
MRSRPSMNSSARSATWNDAPPGLHAGEFQCVARGGFGDPCNAYPHAMAWFQDRLYVGTTRCVLLLIQMRTENMRNWKCFPVRPAVKNAHAEYDTRGQIWRWTPETDTWECLLVSPRMPEQDGVAWPMYHGVRGMVVHRAPHEAAPSLYVTTWSPKGGPGVKLLRTTDGTHFADVPLNGIAQERYSSIRALAAYKGRLFCSPGSLKGVSQNVAGVVGIYATRDPLREPWVQVNVDNFGDGHIESASDMAVFNGALYVGTRNPRGFELWKTDAEGRPPYTWQRVIAGGAGRGPLNETIASLSVFRGALYAGTSISNGGYDRDHGIGPAACEIIRVHPDDSWDLVMGSGRLTERGFKGPLSGYGPGFDNPCNGYLWRMCAHDGWLYAGTFCALSFLPFLPIERWGDARRMLIETELPALLEKQGGFDLWRTRDGRCWHPVTRNGFGNVYNYGVRSLISTPAGLVVGAANPFAPEVGMPRRADWRFEPNPRGGLEIWIGRPGGAAPPEAAEAAEAPAEAFDTGGDTDAFVADAVREFYGGDAFRTVGFWGLRTETPAQAFETLVRELLAFLPETPPGAMLLLDAASPDAARIVQRCRRPETLAVHAAVRGRAPGWTLSPDDGMRLLARTAPPLPLAAGSCDAVLNIETLSRSGRARAWIAEAFRVLKPGGTFAAAVLLPAHARSPWRMGRAPVTDPAGFDAWLRALGFADTRVLDVTRETWRPFRESLAAFERRKMLDNALNQDLRLALEDAVFGPIEPLAAVVLAAGRKP